MGSFLAGVKAGTLSGLIYVGGIAIFNTFLLLALKADVIQAITQSYSQVCAGSPQVNGTLTPEGCYSLLLAVDVPYIAFIGFFITLVYMGLFGMFFEKVPGRGALLKGETIAVLVGFTLLLFGFYGFSFNYTSGLATGAFLVLWTPVFGYLAGMLYRRYTRLVSFELGGLGLGKILVDGKNLTGTARTFATRSTHEVRAEETGESFKGWGASGGVRVEDSHSYETTMEVEGDGVLKLQTG